MRKIFLWIALISAVLDASAQNISRKVVASTGGTFSNSQNMVTFTIGETMVQTLSSSNSMITQGFQQPDEALGGYQQNLQSANNYNFDAQKEQRTSKLRLETDLDVNTGEVVLERLNNQTKQYEAIEKQPVTAINNGNTDFNFTDKDPQEGDNYYRVKQILSKTDIEKGNEVTYSKVRKLNFNANDFVKFFPNPARDYVNVDLAAFEGKDAVINILSELGQTLLTKRVEKLGADPIRIALDGIETGMYLLRVDVNNNKGTMKQFIIAK